MFEHSDGVGSGVPKETELADRAQADAQPRCGEPKHSLTNFTPRMKHSLTNFTPQNDLS